MKVRASVIGTDRFVDVVSSIRGGNRSPHLVGYWPLSHQNFICARDVSGNDRHLVSVNGGMSGIKANSSGRLQPTSAATGRLVNSPTDPRFNLTIPGASWIMTVVHRCDSSSGGGLPILCNGNAVSSTSIFTGIVNNAGKPRLRVVISNSNYFSSDFAAPFGTDTHIAVFRDGVAGRVYVYLNGEIDAGFNGGAGYVTYAPASMYSAANLALAGYGANITGSDMSGPSAGPFTLGHLQLYMVPEQYMIPNPAGLIKKLAADFTRILTAEELP